MEGDGDGAERFVLDALPMSQLLDRARALGCPQDVLDDLMDRDEPRAEVLQVVSENVGLGSAGGVYAIILANIVAIFLMRIVGKNLDA